MKTDADLWCEVLTRLTPLCGGPHHQEWLRGSSLLRREPNRALIRVPHEMARQWIERSLGSAVRSALREATGKHLEVAYVTDAAPGESSSAEAGPDGAPLMRLDDFIVCGSNRLVYQACLLVVAAPGSGPNPLFIHGRSGSGKSHLLQGIAGALVHRYGPESVLMTTGREFSQHYAASIRGNRSRLFRDRNRALRALVVDDIHLLAGREGSQVAFFHTFDHLRGEGVPIVVSATRPPKDLEGFVEVSRFQSGLVLGLDHPGADCRRILILQTLRKGPCAECVPEEVVDYLSRNLHGSVGEIVGAVRRLEAYALLCGAEIDVSTARRELAEFLSCKGTPLTLAKIEGAVSTAFGVESKVLRTNSRRREVTVPRQVTHYIARELTEYSLKEIGEHFGGVSHTTVTLSHRRITGRLTTDTAMKGVVEKLIVGLREGNGAVT